VTSHDICTSYSLWFFLDQLPYRCLIKFVFLYGMYDFPSKLSRFWDVNHAHFPQLISAPSDLLITYINFMRSWICIFERLKISSTKIPPPPKYFILMSSLPCNGFSGHKKEHERMCWGEGGGSNKSGKAFCLHAAMEVKKTTHFCFCELSGGPWAF
jgi:hypothetical protein